MIGIVIYLIIVVSSILAIDHIIGLTTDEALYILILAMILLAITLIALHLLPKISRICIRRSRAAIYHHRGQHTNRFLSFKQTFFIIASVILFTCSFPVIHMEKQDVADIPNYLISFGEKYPEASDFVTAYPQKKDRHYIINLKSEVEKGTLPLFIQWDQRWGYQKYGNELIGTAGCGPTCLSMVICGLTGNTEANPLTIANFSEKQGYYIAREGTSWNLMTEGALFWGIDVKEGTVTEKYILEHLTKNTPMICSMYPGDFTYAGHFIVLSGIDFNGNVIIHDPNSYIKSKKHWNLKKITPQIRALWIYSVSDSVKNTL